MRISWIELNGFKSFPERTRIELNEGITCFVGPNGAGKSNIVDAFRWILGEHNPRTLRGEKMEEIIFQGSDSKKEKGLAEVTILLKIKEKGENGNEPHFKETEIRRRFFRTGESYFVVNGKQSRLKDIKEIFISEGVDIRTYAIIDSAKINEILSKASQRKALLEECAGISLYKMKKSESENKLQSARENLQRIEDILGELKKQYSLLERQAKKAERFKKLMEELTALELGVAKTESLQLLEKIQKLEEHIESLEKERNNLKRHSEEIIAKLKNKKGEILNLENAISEKEKYLKQKESLKISGEKELALLGQEEKSRMEYLEKLKREIEWTKREVEQLEKELADAQLEVESLEKKLETFQKDIISYEEDLLKSEDEVGKLEKELEIKRKSLFNLTSELANKKNHYQALRKNFENNQNRLGILREKKRDLSKKIEQIEEDIKMEDEMIKNLQQRLKRENLILNELIEELSINEKTIEDKNQILIECKKKEALLNGKIEAIKSEIWEQEETHRLFFEFLEVSPEMEELIEILLDEKLKASVIDNISQITPSESKRFFFLKNLATKSQESDLILSEINLSEDPVIPIKDLIKVKDLPPREKIFSNIFLVNELKDAIKNKEKYPDHTFITKKGEVVFPDGFIKTGKSGEILKKKRALEEMRKEKQKILDDIKRVEEEIVKIKRQRESLKAEIESKRTGISQLKGEIFKEEEKLKNLQRELEQTKQRVKYTDSEEKALQNEIEDNKKTISRVHSEIQEISSLIEDTELKIEKLKSSQKDILQNREEKKEALANKKIEISTFQERLKNKKIEISRLQENLRKLTTQNSKNLAEIEENAKKIEKIRKQAEENTKKIEQLKEEIERVKEEKQGLIESLHKEKEEVEELEVGYKKGSEELQIITSKIGEKRTEEGQIRIKLETLWREIYNLYGKDILQEEIEKVEEIDRYKARINSLKTSIKEIGPVDMEILREYEEVKERYEFLINQQTDIKTSINELEEAIKKINSLTRKKLRETFDLLREKFNFLFQELFSGGRAEISLTDENNILESDLDINVQPPGKKAGSLNLLSGGEKTLTSIAFVFACLSIRPSPVCILDEVDAPLDDSNTLRLRKMIKQLSDKTQFLIITHNKLMMESADYIYGVTMQEEGVSSVISLELKEAEAYT